MRAHFGLPSVTSGEVDSKKPLSIQFEIPYFTLSGINVRYLKIVDKTGYTAVRSCVLWSWLARLSAVADISSRGSGTSPRAGRTMFCVRYVLCEGRD